MDLTLHIWRQNGPADQGRFETIPVTGVSEHQSFLEMLDMVNENLIAEGKEPFAFDHDCREGICGTCGVMINGTPHGPLELTTACQIHMRHLKGSKEIWVEPWRARAFPVIKDLVVDRSAMDRIIESGGYISIRTGAAQDANETPIKKIDADMAMDAAICIGCGACVAACPNASAMLFMSAKVSHLGFLPQGQPERYERVLRMVETQDEEGFGNCTNHGACQNACPKGISVDFIARLNRDLVKATLTHKPYEITAV